MRPRMVLLFDAALLVWTMSISSILCADSIQNALKDFKAPDSFHPKKFFQLSGMTKKSPQDLKKVFKMMDKDDSGYIEEDELKVFLQRFSADARLLTDKETKAFLATAADNSNGKIGAEKFQAFVLS
ncbi:parvalbumin, thymic CPV3-like [Paramisgurnus dabryanus]|uniref:parvalbumin, thymic CPV3-like n=1 Tax=Paramisgurnus dabryanus TaxID=90735 RepID=UPI0031F3E75A